jgi:hypothetical protein
MVRISDTGDLLLFKNKMLVNKLQRAFTSSQYDHVAMILKYSDGSVQFLESTGHVGVNILSWEEFIDQNWQSLSERIAYRKLTFERDIQDVLRLENFIKDDAIGQKYKLDMKKMIKKR